MKFPNFETIILPGTSLDESSFEFEMETDRNLYLILRNTRFPICLRPQFQREGCWMLSRGKKKTTKQNQIWLK